MKRYKTLKGFLQGLKNIVDNNSVCELSGYNELSNSDKKELSFLIGDIYNGIGIFKKYITVINTIS